MSNVGHPLSATSLDMASIIAEIHASPKGPSHEPGFEGSYFSMTLCGKSPLMAKKQRESDRGLPWPMSEGKDAFRLVFSVHEKSQVVCIPLASALILTPITTFQL